MGAVEWTAASIVIALVLIAMIGWLSRDRNIWRLKVGFFIERERYDKDEDDDKEQETKHWPGG